MLINLINNIAFLVALVAAGQLVISRFHKFSLNRQLLLGLLFGGVALLGMANPVNFAPGVFFDGRSIVLTVAGVVGGGMTAAIAAGMAAVYRYQLGGSGAPIGLMVILLSALLGALARLPTMYWVSALGSVDRSRGVSSNGNACATWPRMPGVAPELMLKRGWKPESIQKVLGGNALRVIEQLRG